MSAEILDVAVIGAGLSGIGAGVHLTQKCPNKNFALFEARGATGGTWDLFRYPGIRSDSDMFTLGYNFKPWTNPKIIADGPSILSYIRETADEYNINNKIRFHHKVIAANWSSREELWELTMERSDTNETILVKSRFVMCCAGYYRYDRGFTPEFAGRDDFKGQIIHPQLWPEDLDYSNKKVVIIGSGATAVTLLPAMTDKAAHVTMLQRSPTYVAAVPSRDKLSEKLRDYLPEKAVYSMGRTRNVLFQLGFYNAARRYPNQVRNLLQGQVSRMLKGTVDMKHFTPKYNPWDERLCAVPSGDMFKALRKGDASVVTDTIDRFVENGILLKSGEVLEADIIITATGLELQMLGGASLSLDGVPVDVSKKLYYKGAMLEDMPNAALVFGYTNSSWTLKADLISEYVCRLLNYMDAKGYKTATPRNLDANVKREPFLDLSAGYVQRVIKTLPQQGDRFPWRLYQNYLKDFRSFKFTKVNDGNLEFKKAA